MEFNIEQQEYYSCGVTITIGEYVFDKNTFVYMSQFPVRGGSACECSAEPHSLEDVRENILEECNKLGVKSIEISDETILKIQEELCETLTMTCSDCSC